MDNLPPSTQKLLVHHPFNQLLVQVKNSCSIQLMRSISSSFENTLNRLYSSLIDCNKKRLQSVFDLFVCIASPQNKRKQLFNTQLVKLFFNVHKSQNLKIMKPHRKKYDTYLLQLVKMCCTLFVWIGFPSCSIIIDLLR